MQDEHGNTTLMAVSSNGHLEIAELLLQQGAMVKHKNKVRVLAGKLGMKFNL